MRKKNYLTLLLLLSIISNHALAGERGPLTRTKTITDSLIISHLSKSVAEIVSMPDRVICYTIANKDSILPSDIVLQTQFVKDSAISVLTKKEINILQYLLVEDIESYKNDSTIIRSPYLPEIGFDFIKKNSTVHVLISLVDYSWTVIYDEKEFLHFNFANKEIFTKFCKQLLNK